MIYFIQLGCAFASQSLQAKSFSEHPDLLQFSSFKQKSHMLALNKTVNKYNIFSETSQFVISKLLRTYNKNIFCLIKS